MDDVFQDMYIRCDINIMFALLVQSDIFTDRSLSLNDMEIFVNEGRRDENEIRI
jgi:hypothetical protein